MKKRYRLYTLKEDLKDELGLTYRFVKESGLIGSLLFFLNPKYSLGRRIEWSSYLGTEVLKKKGIID